MNGNTFFEFDDHVTMVEANRQDAALQAILNVVNALVPGKRVTQVIQSHHHFDHSVGLRAAVAQGLTIISVAETRASSAKWWRVPQDCFRTRWDGAPSR